MEFHDNYLITERKKIILSASSPEDFFRSYFEYRKSKRTDYSLRTFSSKLGYSNPSLLSDIINDKRKLSKSVLERIVKFERFDSLEKKYLENLIEMQNSDYSANLRINNQLIEEYWLGQTTNSANINPIDLILIDVLRTLKKCTLANLVEHHKGSISEPVITSRLQFLLNEKLVKQEGDLFSAGTAACKHELTLTSMKDLYPTLSSCLAKGKKSTQAFSLSCYFTKTEADAAKKIIADAHDKVILLAAESEKKTNILEKKKMHVWFSCLGSVSNKI